MLDTTVAPTTWVYKEVTNCRACGSKMLAEVFNAGDMSIVEFPKIGEQPKKPKVPLCLLICEKCFLVQLRHSTNPAYLYEEFWYRSGTNEMMRAALKDVADKATALVNLQYQDWVLDIGCNDGTLLEFYPKWVSCIGMDPARNLDLSEMKSWGFVCDYFSDTKALDASAGHKYKVVTALAMFYDLDDPVKFCKEVKNALRDDGVFIVQMNYLPTMLKNNGVDNICHEHLTYFSLGSLIPVFEAAGLHIYKAELNSVNGGSIRVYAGHKSAQYVYPHSSLVEILMQEIKEGLNDLRSYVHFGKKVFAVCSELDEWIHHLSSTRHANKVYAYGASTRGATLLQLLKNHGMFFACAERDERKIGRYMAGSDLVIIGEEEFRQDADYALLLPWHFLESIKKREELWLKRGGRFLVPLPAPYIVDWRQP